MKSINYNNWQSWIRNYEKHRRHCKRKWYHVSLYEYNVNPRYKSSEIMFHIGGHPFAQFWIEDIKHPRLDANPLMNYNVPYKKYIFVIVNEFLYDKWSTKVNPILTKTYNYWYFNNKPNTAMNNFVNVLNNIIFKKLDSIMEEYK